MDENLNHKGIQPFFLSVIFELGAVLGALFIFFRIIQLGNFDNTTSKNSHHETFVFTHCISVSINCNFPNQNR
jgi:hypothetical protein